MKMEEYKEVYDKMVISQEADDRILRELLEERGIASGKRKRQIPTLRPVFPHNKKGKVRLAGAAVLAAAAAVALFLVAGGTSLWDQKPSKNHQGIEIAVDGERASEEPDGNGGKSVIEKQEKPGNDEEEVDGKGEGKLDGTGEEGKEEKGEEKDSGEPKNFQVQPVSYPVYDDDMFVGDLPKIKEGYLKNLRSFYKKVFQKMLTGKKGKNQVCSPINLYFTMAMLSEMTAGESREQIMKALGQKNGEEVRKQSRRIWQWLYYSDNDSYCTLGNSLWTRKGDPLKKDTLQALSDNYYASTYQGQMGSTSYDQTIQKWLNKMTGGNLRESVGKVKTTVNTSLVLLSAANFYGTWINHTFDKKDTREGTFYAGSGQKITCDFMKTTGDHFFYDEKRFTATSLGLSGGQDMYIFLPKEDSSLEELLQKDINEILHISTGPEDGGSYIVNLKLPKFKIQGERDLISTMKSMGVTDIFDQGSADFTGLLDVEKENGCYVGKASQAMQVSVDEKGCSVSAYSEAVGFEKGPGPDKKRSMCCDRPFLFVISDRNGMPIFAGTVNRPK